MARVATETDQLQSTAGSTPVEEGRVTLHRRPQSTLAMVREAFAARYLVPRFGARALAKRYARTKLGRLWLVIRPAMEIFGMAFIFGAVLSAPSEGVPYTVFLLVGLSIWRLFDRALYWSTRGFELYGRLPQRLSFPLLLIPVSAAAPGLVEALVYLVFLVGVVAYYALAQGDVFVGVGPELLVAAAGLGLAFAFACGLGLSLSVLNARARDVRFTLRYVLDVWLFVTPVIYPVDALPGAFKMLATVNPMAAPVEMFKHGLIGVGEVQLGAVLVSVGATVAAVVSGLWFFNGTQDSLVRHRFQHDDEDDE